MHLVYPQKSVEHPPDAVSLLQKSSETSEEQPCALRAPVRSFPAMALLSHSPPPPPRRGIERVASIFSNKTYQRTTNGKKVA